MTPKDERRRALFVAEYLVDGNATRAAIAAGFSKKTAHQQGSRLLKNVKVRAQIDKGTKRQLDKAEITKERVLAEIAKIAFLDPRKFFNSDGSPKDITELDDDSAACVAGFEAVELFDGSQGDQKHVTGLVKKLKIADKLRGLELAGKHLVLFTDKQELTGKDGGNIPLSLEINL